MLQGMQSVNWETFILVEMASSWLFQALLKGQRRLFQVSFLFWRADGGAGLLALHRCGKKDEVFCP